MNRFGGRQQGYVGNNGTIDTDYAASIAKRTAASAGSGAFNNGATTSTSFADFDLAYDAINSYEQGSRGGVYTVQAGDTLASIAAALWGDASLWYKLAEINGLTAESALIEGQPLLIPVGVVRNTNNASTFQPYDPLEVLGDTSLSARGHTPTRSPAQTSHRCASGCVSPSPRAQQSACTNGTKHVHNRWEVLYHASHVPHRGARRAASRHPAR